MDIHIEGVVRFVGRVGARYGLGGLVGEAVGVAYGRNGRG